METRPWVTSASRHLLSSLQRQLRTCRKSVQCYAKAIRRHLRAPALWADESMDNCSTQLRMYLILVLLAPVLPSRLRGSKMLGKGWLMPGMVAASAEQKDVLVQRIQSCEAIRCHIHHAQTVKTTTQSILSCDGLLYAHWLEDSRASLQWYEAT